MRWAWDLSETVVGESLLAKDVNDSAVCLVIRGVDSFFASEFAPTVVCASEPDGVPQWVVSNPSHKPGTQRVGDDVSGCCFQVFLAAQGPVEVAFLPYSGTMASLLINESSATRFGGLHQLRQITAVQFNQPVKVIGHDHPSYRRGKAGLLSPSELVHQKAASAPILEDRLSFMGDCGQVVDPTGLRETACA
ncbi:hypothetical protein D3C73_735220 [compost metagenome]|jgi:hypothetical protein